MKIENIIFYLLVILVIYLITKRWKSKFSWNNLKTLNLSDTFKKVLDFDSSDNSYSSFTIPKKDWTPRQIEAPNSSLKKVQKDLLVLLSTNILLPWYITWFRKRFSIKTNALKHVWKSVVINLDIKDFFMNVTQDKLRQRLEFMKIDTEVISRLEKLCFYNWRLPQWAPTSPFIANFLFIPIDEAIINLAKKFDKKMSYSRYADNITISSNVSKISNLIRLISDWIVPKFWYEIKKSKVNLTRKHTRQTVTWIVVNEKTSMPREKFMKLRAKVHTFLVKWTGKADEIAWNLSFLYMLDKKKYWKLQRKYKKKYWDTSALNQIFKRNPKKKKYVYWNNVNPRT